MAPKKQKQKMSLNEFLGDSALGSWADEMDSLPSARKIDVTAAFRTEEERIRGNDRYGRRGDDFLSSRPDRVSGPPREDLPLPTQPPFTAFIGNLAFDLTEIDLEEYFGPAKARSVKIIKDREDKPKGFGYIEFEELDGLKDALAKSGSTFSSRTVRVSVAEPPKSEMAKERGGFGGGFDDDAKFASPWRRDGPLPDLPDSRASSRRRFDAPSSGDAPPSTAEGVSDWRSSSRPRGPIAAETETQSFRRRGSGFSTPEGQPNSADKDEVWTIGGKFKPSGGGSQDENSTYKFGSLKGRGDMGAPKDPALPSDEGVSDWRSAPRPRSAPKMNTSPNSSTPPTPQLTRRKLELLPRSNGNSASPSPLSSPKMPPNASSSRSNPFGNAKPVDVSSREKEVTDRLEKERETSKAAHSMSRSSSHGASDRNANSLIRTPPPTICSTPPTPSSPKLSSVSANVRPLVSFASAAAAKTGAVAEESSAEDAKIGDPVGMVTDMAAEVAI